MKMKDGVMTFFRKTGLFFMYWKRLSLPEKSPHWNYDVYVSGKKNASNFCKTSLAFLATLPVSEKCHGGKYIAEKPHLITI